MSTLSDTQDSAKQSLERYLIEHVDEGGDFFKSRFIASEIEFSASQIGAAFRKLQSQSDELRIEQWSYTRGTTWKVARIE
jgi:hypothetical protein